MEQEHQSIVIVHEAEEAVHNIEETKKELTKASEYQGNQGTYIACLFLCYTLIILLYEWWNTRIYYYN